MAKIMLSTQCHEIVAQCKDVIQTFEGPDFREKSEVK